MAFRPLLPVDRSSEVVATHPLRYRGGMGKLLRAPREPRSESPSQFAHVFQIKASGVLVPLGVLLGERPR